MAASAKLPEFKYHPNPLGTGSIELSEQTCEACGSARGYLYTGAIYGKHDLERICPWCIADGTAHEKFGAEFTDAGAIGDYGAWERVREEIVQEIAFRTPGFSGWQQERWFTHCADAAEFLGPMGRKELENAGPEAVAVVKQESGMQDEEWVQYFQALDRNDGPTAYLFRCRHCGVVGGYSDCH
ncbi:MAG: CbrC family protein [Acidobacteriia bacterium]|nr:CbrC family protein [Terriglobia bacterium]